MSDRPEKRKVEFIESYWTGGEYGSDYKWNDNHGELIRCGDCKYAPGNKEGYTCKIRDILGIHMKNPDCFFCADGKRKDS